MFAFAGVLLPPVQIMNAQQKPNVVFIMADDLGWNDLGVNGSDYYETPNIDRLASQGMMFSNAYSSAANSAPSRACLMSGMYTPRHGIFTVGTSERGDKNKRKLIPIRNTEDLRADFVTMSEALQKNGYRCGHIGKWHLGDDADGTGPLSQGFVLNIAGGRAGTPYSYFYPYCNQKGDCHVGLEKGKPEEYLTDRLTDEAIQFMKESAGKQPFFLYMAHHAVHVPLTAPKELIAKYEKKYKGKYHTNPVYAAMIESLDQSVGKICVAIDSLGLTENTIILFNSDNGGSEPITDNFMLRGGKGNPYEGGIRVPLIIKWQGKVKAGTTSECPVTNVDFYPTLLSLAGGSPDSSLDGVNITPVLTDHSKNIRRDLFWHFPAYLESNKKDGPDFRATPYSIIRSADWKLIYYYESGKTELFNLARDTREENNLVKEKPKVANELENKLKTWLSETHAPIPTKPNPDYKN